MTVQDSLNRIILGFNQLRVPFSEARTAAGGDPIAELQPIGTDAPPPPPDDTNPPPPDDSAPPPSTDPQSAFFTQANTDRFESSSASAPRTNWMEMSSPGSWRARDFSGPGGNPDLVFDDLVAQGLIDQETLLPTAIPAGYSVLLSDSFRDDWILFPDYNRDRGPFILEWNGTADMQLQGNINNDFTIENLPDQNGYTRRRYTAAPTFRGRIGVQINSMDAANPPDDIRIYFENENPDALDGFDPRYVEDLSGYDVIRQATFTRVAETNITRVNQFADGARQWAALEATADRYLRQMPPTKNFYDLCKQANAIAWVNAPPLLGASQTIEPIRTITNGEMDIYARNEAENIVNSTEWRAYVQYLFDAIEASGYDTTKLTILELGIEIWNIAFPFFHGTYALRAIAAYLNSIHNFGSAWGDINTSIQSQANERFGFGWMIARLMHEWDLENAARGTNYPVMGCMAFQITREETLQQSIEGFTQYCNINGLNAAEMLSRTKGFGTHYWSGVLADDTYLQSSVPAGENASYLLQNLGYNTHEDLLAGIQGGATTEDQFREVCVDFYTDINAGFTIPWILDRHREAKIVADNAGMGTAYPDFGSGGMGGNYEGGTHDDWDALRPRTATKDALWAIWYNSEQFARVDRLTADALVAEFGRNYLISNFIVGAPLNIERPAGQDAGLNALVGRIPWNDGHYSETTPMKTVWDQINVETV